MKIPDATNEYNTTAMYRVQYVANELEAPDDNLQTGLCFYLPFL